MSKKTPGFAKIKSTDALTQDLDIKSPMAASLKARRKKNALKHGALVTDTDSLGNPQIKQDENDND